MNIIVHYPVNEKSKTELANRVAAVHIDSVAAYIKKQPWTKEQKLKMLDALTEKCS